MQTMEPNATVIELHFNLNVIEDWPPVSVEGILCTKILEGYRLESPPLFVKGLSVGDIISVEFDSVNNIKSWKILAHSSRTTIWILRTGPNDNIRPVLEGLKSLGCKSVELSELGCYSVDVPAEVSIADVDTLLSSLDPINTAAVFPSFRHN
jgi:Domain of unknown function (DUF4265)